MRLYFPLNKTIHYFFKKSFNKFYFFHPLALVCKLSCLVASRASDEWQCLRVSESKHFMKVLEITLEKKSPRLTHSKFKFFFTKKKKEKKKAGYLLRIFLPKLTKAIYFQALNYHSKWYMPEHKQSCAGAVS